ncbi:MAG: peptidoglycan DD-metalloendopeptidase family protein [Acidimicrobiales bacterium]
MSSIRHSRLIAALVSVLVLAVFVPTAASEDPKDTEEIKEAREERKEARRNQLEASIELKFIEAEDIEVVAALEAATELVNLQLAKVDAVSQRLQASDDALADAEAALVAVQVEIDNLRARAVDAAVASYVGLSDERNAVWLNTDDATMAAHKIAILDTVEADAFEVLDQLRAIEERRGELLELADAARRDAEEIETELADALVDLEVRQAVQLEIKAELEARRDRWEGALADAEVEEQRLTDWIRAEQARIEEELRRRREAELRLSQSQARPGIIGTGGWTWPTGGGVASGYGQRLHPILGYYRLHSGMDIGGAMGQPIWAAHEGIVASAGWNGGYGNTVIIGHGDNTTTLYAHMSGFTVSPGTFVSPGDVIGYVGSTGLSTGPHLHSEVRINGIPVNPAPYLP